MSSRPEHEITHGEPRRSVVTLIGNDIRSSPSSVCSRVPVSSNVWDEEEGLARRGARSESLLQRPRVYVSGKLGLLLRHRALDGSGDHGIKEAA